jgi:hypothetical protein
MQEKCRRTIQHIDVPHRRRARVAHVRAVDVATVQRVRVRGDGAPPPSYGAQPRDGHDHRHAPAARRGPAAVARVRLHRYASVGRGRRRVGDADGSVLHPSVHGTGRGVVAVLEPRRARATGTNPSVGGARPPRVRRAGDEALGHWTARRRRDGARAARVRTRVATPGCPRCAIRGAVGAAARAAFGIGVGERMGCACTDAAACGRRSGSGRRR